MFELFGGIIEALSGYILGRFQAKDTTAKQVSIIAVSLLCGLIFFVGNAIHDGIFPPPKVNHSWGFDLAIFSLAISVIIYGLIILDIWWKNKKVKSKG